MTNKKHDTFCLESACDIQLPTELVIVIQEVCHIFVPPPQLFFIQSVVSLQRAIENLWENVPIKGKYL